jgi:hypothetical protein
MPGLEWDPRLITPERALELAGHWELIVDAQWAELSQFESESGGERLPDRGQFNLRCRLCGQSCRLLGEGPPNQPVVKLGEIRPLPFDLEGLLSAVLRHMVMAHDVPLNRAAENGAAP